VKKETTSKLGVRFEEGVSSTTTEACKEYAICTGIMVFVCFTVDCLLFIGYCCTLYSLKFFSTVFEAERLSMRSTPLLSKNASTDSTKWAGRLSSRSAIYKQDS
jgi:hypothetical protein